MPRRRRGGFSMVELAMALTVFLIFVTASTLVVAQTQLSKAWVHTESAVRDELGRLIAVAGTAPFAELVTDRFTRPDACADDPARSCVQVGGRNLSVQWSVSADQDPLGLSVDAASAVQLTASAALTGLGTVQETRTVINPSPGTLDGAGVVRVTVTGSYTGPLYLTAGNPSAAVGAGTVTSGEALIRVAQGVCDSSAGCQLALTPDGAAYNATHALDVASSTDTHGVRVAPNEVVDVGVQIAERADLTVKLWAQNSTATGGAPTENGSVCLWLHLSDSVEISGCNDSDAGYVTFGTFEYGGRRLHLHAGQKARLDVDNSAGTCPQVDGMKGVRRGIWSTLAVCTSHTWGRPWRLSGPAGNADADSTFTLAGDTRRTLVWRPAEGSPAAGYDGEPTWAFPRDADPCSNDGSCTTTGTDPESQACDPGEHCLSDGNAAPALTSPRRGDARLPVVVVAAGTSDNVTLSVTDFDAAPTDPGVQVLVSATPSAGTLRHNGSTVSAGQVVDAFAGSGDVTFTFDAPAQYTLVRFTVTLTDQLAGGSRDVTVGISSGAGAVWSLDAEPVLVAQGSSAPATVHVTGDDGDTLADATVTASWPAGHDAPADALSGNDGDATFAVGGGTMTRGRHTATFSSGGAQTTAPISVAARAGNISLDAPDVAQGARSTVTATVTDRAGDPLTTGVRLTVLRDGVPSPGAWVAAGGCHSSGGACHATLSVERAAEPGTYQLHAAADSATATVTFTVEGDVGSLRLVPFTVAQGASSSVQAYVFDGEGNGLAGETVAVNVAGTGVTVNFPNPSGQGGLVTGTATATGNATSGIRDLTLTAGRARSSGRFTVRGSVATITASGPTTVAQGDTLSVPLQALDGTGLPVNDLTFSVTGELTASVAQRSDVNGQAQLAVQAQRSTPTGSYPVTVSSGGVSVTVMVSVTPSVSSASLSGSIPAGGGGTLTVTLRDARGELLVNQPVTLRSLSSQLTLSDASVRTDSFGRFSVTGSCVSVGVFLVELQAGAGTARVAVVAVEL